MLEARVEGSIVCTHCHPSMHGWRHLLCQPLDAEGADTGVPVVAVDPLGAGLHSRVVLTSDGLGTRELVGDEHSPLRYHLLAIIDGEER